jgi:hypothetical protein
MKNELSKIIKSGKDEDKREYKVKVLCNGMTPEQAQEDAFHYYVWKIQRVIRDASEVQKAAWAKGGITVHYTEVGKKVEDPETTVGKMSDDQARVALEALMARFGKGKKV